MVSQIRMDGRTDDGRTDGLTGQWVPYTKIWLRAMSTLFQAKARLSWSGADALVPGITCEHRQSYRWYLVSHVNTDSHTVGTWYHM